MWLTRCNWLFCVTDSSLCGNQSTRCGRRHSVCSHISTSCYFWQNLGTMGHQKYPVRLNNPDGSVRGGLKLTDWNRRLNARLNLPNWDWLTRICWLTDSSFSLIDSRNMESSAVKRTLASSTLSQTDSLKQAQRRPGRCTTNSNSCASQTGI